MALALTLVAASGWAQTQVIVGAAEAGADAITGTAPSFPSPARKLPV